jgi:hypothetical protein
MHVRIDGFSTGFPEVQVLEEAQCGLDENKGAGHDEANDGMIGGELVIYDREGDANAETGGHDAKSEELQWGMNAGDDIRIRNDMQGEGRDREDNYKGDSH